MAPRGQRWPWGKKCEIAIFVNEMMAQVECRVRIGKEKSLIGQFALWAKPCCATWASPGPVDPREKKYHAEGE